VSFEIGDVVVYPRHGAASIEDIVEKTVRGQKMTMLKIEVVQGAMTILVPPDKVEEVGIRTVVDSAGLDRVYEVLQAKFTEEPTNWSRRYKANVEKLGSGEVLKVAEVVRDLSRREADRDKGLSAGEKRMLAQARKILISELALAHSANEIEAIDILDRVLAGDIVEVKPLELADATLAA
jgi:CarD family transcriptional regulator